MLALEELLADLKTQASGARAEAEAFKARLASSTGDSHQLLELQVTVDSQKIKIDSLAKQLAAADKNRSDTVAHYEQQLEAQASRMSEMERRASRRSSGGDAFSLQADLKAVKATADEVRGREAGGQFPCVAPVCGGALGPRLTLAARTLLTRPSASGRYARPCESATRRSASCEASRARFQQPAGSKATMRAFGRSMTPAWRSCDSRWGGGRGGGALGRHWKAALSVSPACPMFACVSHVPFQTKTMSHSRRPTRRPRFWNSTSCAPRRRTKRRSTAMKWRTCAPSWRASPRRCRASRPRANGSRRRCQACGNSVYPPLPRPPVPRCPLRDLPHLVFFFCSLL